MAKNDEKLARLKAEADEHYQRVQNAGGALAYCIEYLTHLVSLKGDGEHVVIRESRASYPKMAVQMAAVAAVQRVRKEGVDAEAEAETEKWARASWVHSAGHYFDQGSNDDHSEVVEHLNAEAMRMVQKGANTRKAKAEEQWDRLIGKDIENLATLALFNHETAKPLSRKDRWIGYTALVGIVVAIISYGASNWYLSTKVTADYSTDEGIKQRQRAIERVLAYDKMMSSTARRSGIFKLVLDWPMSPTEAENNAVVELGTDIVGLFKAMSNENLICGGTELNTDKAFEVVNAVSNNINFHDETQEPFGRAESLIVKALGRLYPLPCR